MTNDMEGLRGRLSSARAEALKVGDSPLRADRVAAQVQLIADSIDSMGLGEEKSARMAAALSDALRVLRRDDDGQEAARHLRTALSLLEPGARRPSPFLDD